MPKATAKTKPPSSTKLKSVKIGSSAAPKRFDPLTAYNTSSQSSQSSTSPAKGKGKEKEKDGHEIRDDRLWVDIYEPSNEAELAVHVKKVQDVRNWLQEALHGGPSGKLRKYRKVLALTGPAGAAKTATLRILAQEMAFNILEWKNGLSESSLDLDYETLSSKFDSFLARAANCANLASVGRQQVILLEDLPNLLHTPTQERFQAALAAHVANPTSIPVIVIISDAGLRGEHIDEGHWRERDSVLDVRTVMGKNLLNGPYVTKINFNPIAPTLMRKALNVLLSRHFGSSTKKGKPSKDTIETIINNASGDIRSAIMALQFTSIARGSKSKVSKERGESFEISSRREQSLALFHLLGKVLYNKRKHDPPAKSATLREKELENELDDRLIDPDELPEHLLSHERLPSRVNIDAIYADSPVDSSLFSLYIHQNYPQFCDGIEECEGISEMLSLVDDLSSSFIANNPHRFHQLALGTLHSLPVPVERRGQKMLKPDWFDFNRRRREIQIDMEDVLSTLTTSSRVHGFWNQTQLATELGGWLKAHPARSTTTFWMMKTDNSSGHKILDELDVPEEEEIEEDRGLAVVSKAEQEEWWQDADDIADWD